MLEQEEVDALIKARKRHDIYLIWLRRMVPHCHSYHSSHLVTFHHLFRLSTRYICAIEYGTGGYSIQSVPGRWWMGRYYLLNRESTKYIQLF
jgi:hypothetical protein